MARKCSNRIKSQRPHSSSELHLFNPPTKHQLLFQWCEHKAVVCPSTSTPWRWHDLQRRQMKLVILLTNTQEDAANKLRQLCPWHTLNKLVPETCLIQETCTKNLTQVLIFHHSFLHEFKMAEKIVDAAADCQGSYTNVSFSMRSIKIPISSLLHSICIKLNYGTFQRVRSKCYKSLTGCRRK